MTTTVDLSGVYLTPPPVPSKYDIIPIHTSDRGTFKSCRRRWNWSSPAKDNLVPKLTVSGVTIHLWFGTGIHYALERYYNPGLSEDPIVTFESWFNMHWNGGNVTKDELDEHGLWNRNPVLSENGYYQVDGLSELLPDPYTAEEKFMEHKALGIGMMKFYKKYAEQHDNFRVIATEHTFSVPLLDTNGFPMYAVDTRTMPENWEYDFDLSNAYGALCLQSPQGVVKQVHARGKMDMIIQDLESGRYGIIDHKTAGTIGPDYFRHLDLDEQVTTYAWAAEREAIMYDLDYKEIDFIYYQALLKAIPRPPSVTTRGLPSINRADESTTAAMFEAAIEVMGLTDYFKGDEKMQSYYTWLLEKGDSRFIDRQMVRRNKHQKRSCGERLFLEASDMLDENIRIYPNPTKDYPCLNCWFRVPCIMVEDGSHYQVLIEENYERNWDR